MGTWASVEHVVMAQEDEVGSRAEGGHTEEGTGSGERVEVNLMQRRRFSPHTSEVEAAGRLQSVGVEYQDGRVSYYHQPIQLPQNHLTARRERYD